MAISTIICSLCFITAEAQERGTLHSTVTTEEPHNISINTQTGGGISQYSLVLKTNVIGWAMLIGNIAAEFPLSKRLTLNFPIYYSGVNLFNSITKFRMFGTMPEVRWNFGKRRQFYAGAHLGLAWYNFAFSGRYRIQDAGGHHPAFGGGFSLGYRLSLSKRIPLGVEFTAGAGIYSLKSDKFFNEQNGAYWQRDVAKTALLPDSFSISLYYGLNFKRGGAK